MTRDRIDELLDGPVGLPDDGFTSLVMATLPRHGPASRPLEGWLLALGAGVAAAVLAPEVARLVGPLADGAMGLGGGLSRALAGSGGSPPGAVALLATATALGVAALGAWKVTEPA